MKEKLSIIDFIKVSHETVIWDNYLEKIKKEQDNPDPDPYAGSAGFLLQAARVMAPRLPAPESYVEHIETAWEPIKTNLHAFPDISHIVNELTAIRNSILEPEHYTLTNLKQYLVIEPKNAIQMAVGKYHLSVDAICEILGEDPWPFYFEIKQYYSDEDLAELAGKPFEVPQKRELSIQDSEELKRIYKLDIPGALWFLRNVYKLNYVQIGSMLEISKNTIANQLSRHGTQIIPSQWVERANYQLYQVIPEIERYKTEILQMASRKAEEIDKRREENYPSKKLYKGLNIGAIIDLLEEIPGMELATKAKALGIPPFAYSYLKKNPR